tara:strand:+ start:184 stop:369 length:186 start_codon:yes stop_codon:yes gene_type:complete
MARNSSLDKKQLLQEITPEALIESEPQSQPEPVIKPKRKAKAKRKSRAKKKVLQEIYGDDL